MDAPGHDRRKSASVNAAVLLAAALIPLLGAIDTPEVDHSTLRPWGCRTCAIPSDPIPAEVAPDPL